MTKRRRRLGFLPDLSREPVTLALLTGLAVALFVAVSGLSRLYRTKLDSMARQAAASGAADLSAHRYKLAASDFRTALTYSRDDYFYRFDLAEALLGEKRPDEAYVYLINLWERQPEDGQVNLELARIAAGKGEKLQALRFYHNAIYAVWPNDPEDATRSARLELIEYLLQIQSRTQAQSEVIALEPSMTDNAAREVQLGDLFLRVEDYDHALIAFRSSLKLDRHNEAALAGAGFAAFQSANYPVAQQYLQVAVAIAPTDARSAALLQTDEMVLQMDPFRPRIGFADRNQIVLSAFAAAGQRLNACLALAGIGATQQQDLQQEWLKMKPRITLRALRRNPDMVYTAMDMVFRIERMDGNLCGNPSAADTALLLIAKLHEEI